MPNPEENLEAILEKGLELHQSGNLNDAAECYRQILAKDPDHVDALFLLSGVQMSSGKEPEAVTMLSRALEIEPGFYPAYRPLGDAYKNLGNWKEAFAIYRKQAELMFSPGAPVPDDEVIFHYISKSKLKHDIEQLNYLMAKGLIDTSYEKIVEYYTELLEHFPINPDDPYTAPLPPVYRPLLESVYNRHVYLRDTPALDKPALNKAIDWSDVEKDYEKNQPGITYIDNFLKPEALNNIRDHCLESTFWHEFRYPNGYLGAFMREGFPCPLIEQVIEELAAAMPKIFKNHKILNLWGYKYDSKMTGINLHADQAAVNVNFWVTPDEANLDPNSGGLMIWDKEAPLDWDFEQYNADQDAMNAFIEESGAKPVCVPHKQNRAVIFNSDLFHATDEFEFKEGYENRRINITLLYGHRYQE